jgi:hypothetical protein
MVELEELTGNFNHASDDYKKNFLLLYLRTEEQRYGYIEVPNQAGEHKINLSGSKEISAGLLLQNERQVSKKHCDSKRKYLTNYQCGGSRMFIPDPGS